jgi:Putative Flp pilus-assembly TadE/G-like
MRSATPRRHHERGVTLVIMAITVFLTLGMAALAIDYGMIKSAQAEAQRAMDSAALAGASAFLIGDPAVDKVQVADDRAREFAAKHTVHTVPIDATVGAEVQVDVDLPNETVTAIFTRNTLRLWFAAMFGSTTMGITERATAHAVLSGVSTCLMPVAVPDMWRNTLPDLAEDANGDGLMDYKDANGNHQWDFGTAKGKQIEPWEQWTFDPAEGDVYNPPTSVDPTGYGSTTRDNVTDPVTGQPRTGDYGRQMVMMDLDPGGTNVASNYLAWGKDGTAASDSALAARIRNPSCDETTIGNTYIKAANGSKPNLGQAWADRINSDPASANWTWDDVNNTASCGGSPCAAGWEDNTPRVVAIALYDPIILTRPQDNAIQFNNFAKVFLDKRPCSGAPGQCKAEVTARFLGFVGGVGSPGITTGPLVKHLVLIK